MRINFSLPALKSVAIRNNLKETLLRKARILIPTTNKRSEHMLMNRQLCKYIHLLVLNAKFAVTSK